jgi:hypothetical protein
MALRSWQPRRAATGPAVVLPRRLELLEAATSTGVCLPEVPTGRMICSYVPEAVVVV